jgi:hypothetical protein
VNFSGEFKWMMYDHDDVSAIEKKTLLKRTLFIFAVVFLTSYLVAYWLAGTKIQITLLILATLK